MTDKVSDEQLWSWVDRDAAELRSYLERHPEERPRVDGLRRELAALGDLAGVRPADLSAPDHIGPYRVTGLLGAGGMGVVYSAIQSSPQREVAVKVMRERGAAGPALRARFEREIAALGRLQHPAIATIHEAGTTDDGTPYLVMERVRGGPLTRWAADTGADLHRRLQVLAAVADGVDAAHRAGVAHRDLKPGNVLVDGDGRPKLVDFGLARLLDRDAMITLTQPGGFAGTLGYVAPERLDGEALDGAGELVATTAAADDRDVRADVYALGVLLYELATGRLPHPVTGVSLAAMVDAVCHRAPPPPSSVQPGLDRRLDRVCAMALARDPAARYPTAAAFADDLRRMVDGRPLQALRSPAPRRRARWLAAAAVATIALATAPFWASRTDALPAAAAAPFSAIQWVGEQPEVRVAAGWVQLCAVEGIAVADLVASCRNRHGDAWRRWFGEQLPEVLRGRGVAVGDGVDLRVCDIGGSAERTLPAVPVTAAAGDAVRRAGVVMADGEVALAGRLSAAFDPRALANPRVPFVDIRRGEGGLEVKLEPDAPWRRWVAIDGLDTEHLERVCRRAFTTGWLDRVAEDLEQVLTLLGRPAAAEVAMTLRDGDGGEARETVAMTKDKRRQVMRTQR